MLTSDGIGVSYFKIAKGWDDGYLALIRVRKTFVAPFAAAPLLSPTGWLPPHQYHRHRDWAVLGAAAWIVPYCTSRYMVRWYPHGPRRRHVLRARPWGDRVFLADSDHALW